MFILYKLKHAYSKRQSENNTSQALDRNLQSFFLILTFIPSCAALIDATYPPGPEPMTTRSTSPKKQKRHKSLTFKFCNTLMPSARSQYCRCIGKTFSRHLLGVCGTQILGNENSTYILRLPTKTIFVLLMLLSLKCIFKNADILVHL